MKLFAWLHRKPAAPPPAGRMCCVNCGGSIHKSEKYRILAVAHRDCGDPKQVGQKSLTKEKYGQAEANQVFAD